jgi:hypothetical protein
MSNEWLERDEDSPPSDHPVLQGAYVIGGAVLSNPTLRISRLVTEYGEPGRDLARQYMDVCRELAATTRAENGMHVGMIAGMVAVSAVLGIGSQEEAEAYLGEKLTDTPEGFARTCDLYAEKIQEMIDNATNGSIT